MEMSPELRLVEPVGAVESFSWEVGNVAKGDNEGKENGPSGPSGLLQK